MNKFVAIFFAVLSTPCFSADWEESSEVNGLFTRSGVSGTFVLYDSGSGKFIGHNPQRSEVRFVPASTFKIANSLIGLSVGAVKDVDDILPYGGQKQLFKIWERDMGLREAISISNIPIYQALARRTGLERMQAYVTKLGFGNEDIGTSIDTFWLDGPLEISAQEQAIFLSRLAQDQLPVSKDIQKAVRDIVLLEQGEGWKLYGKTGWENVPNPGVGWWVGWVTKGNHVYSFALNMDIKNPSDAKQRVKLGKESLKALGIL
ncbi:class D beta-lactamase [Microbulbifer elongatus]|uniref:class D beta-lactamase n=1 Tax=Microbulbifer elongatus TaxID=86173 RepID=UPI001E2ADEFB|nr:class D beta-lactamase [Microbulbifer elongatus]